MCFRWLYASVPCNSLEGRQCILATDHTRYVGRQTTDWQAGGSGQKVCLRVLQETCAPLRSFDQDTRQDWLTPAQAGLNLNSVNQLISVMVKCGVLFEVRTEFLNNI
jgi:hypothetical protein